MGFAMRRATGGRPLHSLVDYRHGSARGEGGILISAHPHRDFPMSSPDNPPREPFLERLSRVATDWSGSSGAFWLAVLTVLVWLLSGPYFRFSDTWQLVINTG